MRVKRAIQFGFVCILTAALISIALWAPRRAARLRYEKLTGSGVIAQRDESGRIVQINFWPAGLSDEELSLLSRMPRLRLLNLTQSELTDAQLQHVENAQNLEELILVATHVSDAGLPRLANLPKLKKVILTPSDVTSAGLRQLHQARPELEIVANPLELHGLGGLVKHGGHGQLNDEYELVALDLRDLKSVSDDDLQGADKCSHLKMINLSGTNLGDAALAHLQGLKNVEELWLTGTNVSDEGLKIVAEFPHLRSISLAQTRISDAGLAHLKSLSELEVLHIGDTDASDEGLLQLSQLKHLKDVYVTQSRVTTDGAEDLARSIPAVQVYGGATPEKPVEEIESRVLG